jgi:thioredoxin reductase (NADPH)
MPEEQRQQQHLDVCTVDIGVRQDADLAVAQVREVRRVGGPVRITDDLRDGQLVYDLLPEVPTATWGRDEFRAEKILQDRLFAHPKIEVIWNVAVEEVLGVVDGVARNVTGVRLKNVQDGSTQEIPADGVFIAIGHAPSSDLFKGQLETNSGGYIRVKPGTAQTAIEGVWAAGDVTDDVYRQAVTAAGMGCMAALEASRFLAEEDHAKANHPISHKEAEKIGVW